jgi:signal peptidase II
LNNSKPAHLRWLWLSAVLIVIDQASKFWAEHILQNEVIPIFSWFDLSLVHNTGAAFGFLNGFKYGSVWAGGAAIVLCVIRARKEFELRKSEVGGE